MSRRVLFAVALLGLLAGGCQVKIAARVDVGRDGHGRVSAGLGLDAEALAEVGDPATALRVDDLRQAGWDVQGPRKEGDGLTWVRVSKPFADPDQATAAMAELSGAGGPFKDLRLVRTKSLLRSKTTFTGVLDLAGGLAGLSDPDLATQLGDVDLGLDVEGLKRRFGDDLAKTNAPARDGGRAVWAPELGQSVQLEASSEALKVDPVLLSAGGAAVVLILLVVVLTGRRRRRRRR